MDISAITDIKMHGTELFMFEGGMFEAITIDNQMGQGYIVFINDTSTKAQIFESILNQLDLGLEVFDSRGHLMFLNNTCKKIESLIKENVIGKHLQDIYEVDQDYSTMLTTIQHKKPVKNRCDNFANRFGDAVTSINSGYPLYVEDLFYGAFGVVLDMETLTTYTEKQAILQRYLNQTKGKPVKNHQMKGYYTFEHIIGESAKIREAVNIAQKVAASDFSVLLLGETGTGKEMFAQSLHSASTRDQKPFIAINCAAIPSSILESSLFGTIKGSFTGSGNQRGLLDEANGGTLFLDEINSMDIQVQSKLLRVLQEKNFRRVGGLKDIACDFRVIAAMNEPPAAALEGNRLRVDLYYRLNTISIEVPPLRARTEDIPVLVKYYIHKLSHTGGKFISGVTDEAMALLMEYDWPGNVRELFHALEYAFALVDSDNIDITCFPKRLLLHKDTGENRRQNFLRYDIREQMQDYEKRLIEEALSASEYNISRAAKSLNLSRQSLQHRMKKCGVKSDQAAKK